MSVQDKKSKGVVDVKKTSTPVGSTTPEFSESTVRGSRTCRSPRIVIPKLDLDMTVTPILPVTTPSFEKNQQRSAKSVSFSNKPKCHFVEATPKLPTEKVSAKRTGSGKQQCKPESDKKDLKRKQTAKDEESASREPVATGGQRSSTRTAKKQKLAGSSLDEISTAQSGLFDSKKKPEASSVKHSEDDKNPLPAESATPCSQNQNASHSKKPKPMRNSVRKKNSSAVKSTKKTSNTGKNKVSGNVSAPKGKKPKAVVDDGEVGGVWQPGKEKMYCTPHLYDSGISLGEDVSAASASSPPALTLPDFMEDEPLQSDLRDLTASPVTSPVSIPSLDPGKKLYIF
jgi:hypothetical protein